MANKLSLALVLVIFLLINKLSPLQAIQHRFLLNTCAPYDELPGHDTHCNTENGAECCKAGEKYPLYKCSPDVSSSTPAVLTLNSFKKGGDGGGPPSCDNTWHEDNELVVALSTGWYNGGSRCLKNIRIRANGKTVLAKVVDECDSTAGCDKDHDYQPPCHNNIVDASNEVWKALGISGGMYDVTWSDA